MKTSLNNIPVNKVIDPVRVSILVITNLILLMTQLAVYLLIHSTPILTDIRQDDIQYLIMARLLQPWCFKLRLDVSTPISGSIESTGTTYGS